MAEIQIEHSRHVPRRADKSVCSVRRPSKDKFQYLLGQSLIVEVRERSFGLLMAQRRKVEPCRSVNNQPSACQGGRLGSDASICIPLCLHARRDCFLPSCVRR